MINEVMPPGEAGLFNQTLSGLAKIRYQKNYKNLADINPVRPASLKRPTERKEAVPQSSVWNCVASHIYDTKRKLKRMKLSGILSISKST